MRPACANLHASSRCDTTRTTWQTDINSIRDNAESEAAVILPGSRETNSKDMNHAEHCIGRTHRVRAIQAFNSISCAWLVFATSTTHEVLCHEKHGPFARFEFNSLLSDSSATPGGSPRESLLDCSWQSRLHLKHHSSERMHIITLEAGFCNSARICVVKAFWRHERKLTEEVAQELTASVAPVLTQ